MAIASPIGTGAISVIRMSGKESLRILKDIIDFKKKPKARFAHHGWIKDPQTGEIVDEVIYVYYESPRSYTGEDMVEIFCHGGILVTKRILEIILKDGARLAEPGEFTKRAFLNGKMDLMQSEAVRDIIESRTEMGMNLSLRQLKGENSRVLEEIREKLLKLSAEIEVHIDYPEEDLPDEDLKRWKKELKRIAEDVENILKTADLGVMLRNGVKVVIIGKTNVGKSTLLNRLLKEDRAIVTDIPGTTRDIISEDLNIGGILLKITDTAGVRKTEDEIEMIGQRKTMNELEKSDLVLFIVDGSRRLSEEDFEIKKILGEKKKKYILVLNKMDLELRVSESELKKLEDGSKGMVRVSALKGDGMKELEETVRDVVMGEKLEEKMKNLILTNTRQKESMRKCYECIKRALENFETFPIDMVSLDIREAVNHIDEILGKVYTGDLLERIFSTFCVGK